MSVGVVVAAFVMPMGCSCCCDYPRRTVRRIGVVMGMPCVLASRRSVDLPEVDARRACIWSDDLGWATTFP